MPPVAPTAPPAGAPRWTPLLEGAPAAAALDAARAIMAALDAAPPDPAPALASGAAGRAVAGAYLARLAPPAADAAVAEAHAERAVAAVGDLAAVGLYAGAAGVAWAAEHLERLAGGAGAAPDGGFDELLAELLADPAWAPPDELTVGLVGLGVYALERLPAAGAAACVEAIVARLAARAVAAPDGVAWRHVALFAGAPAVDYDLGLAHGVAGVLAFLAAAHAAGVARAPARALLEAGVPWLLAREVAGPDGAVGYPAVVPAAAAAGGAPGPARLAWCYGDLSVAVAVHHAARALGVPAWDGRARALARRAAARPPAQSGARDASLCHGDAGIAHVFNRLFQATGEPACRAAAEAWYARALARRRPGAGVAGYAYWDPTRGAAVAVPGLLEGAAGVALALAAAATPAAPAWDRFLLLSVRDA